MSDDTQDPPLGSRLMRTGLAYAMAFGGALMAIQMVANNAEDGSEAINLILVMANALPVGLVCAAVMFLAGVVLKLRDRASA